MNNRTIQPSGHHAAILLRGGKQKCADGGEPDPSCHTYADFDFWKYAQDFDEILKTDADRLVLGASREDVEAQLESQYPNSQGLPRLLFGEQLIPIGFQVNPWSHRRRYNTDHMTGWRVLDHPLVTKADFDSVEKLQILSLECNGLYVDDDLFAWLGYESGAHEHGFVVKGEIGKGCYSHSQRLIRYHPRHFQLRTWRADKQRVEKLLEGQYPQDLLAVIEDCLSPSNWPKKHRFADLITSNGNCSPTDLLRLLRFNQVLGPKRRFWRQARGQRGEGHGQLSFHQAVEELLVYHYGVLDTARATLKKETASPSRRRDARQSIKFTHWLLSEAQALKLEVPERPAVPPKPLDPLKAAKPQHRIKTLDLVIDGLPVREFHLPSGEAQAMVRQATPEIAMPLMAEPVEATHQEVLHAAV
jgi:hypothetical protein